MPLIRHVNLQEMPGELSSSLLKFAQLVSIRARVKTNQTSQGEWNDLTGSLFTTSDSNLSQHLGPAFILFGRICLYEASIISDGVCSCPMGHASVLGSILMVFLVLLFRTEVPALAFHLVPQFQGFHCSILAHSWPA